MAYQSGATTTRNFPLKISPNTREVSKVRFKTRKFSNSKKKHEISSQKNRDTLYFLMQVFVVLNISNRGVVSCQRKELFSSFVWQPSFLVGAKSRVLEYVLWKWHLFYFSRYFEIDLNAIIQCSYWLTSAVFSMLSCERDVSILSLCL